MKRLLSAIAAVALTGAASQALAAGPTASANGASDATVVKPISLAAVGTLDFGKLVIMGGGTSAELRTGDYSIGGPVVSTPCQRLFNEDYGKIPSPFSCAQFNVSGEPNASYSLSLPASIQISGPGSPLTVDNFAIGTKYYWFGGDLDHTRVLGATGADSFKVGARVTAAVSTTPGAYSGSFTVSVNYD